VNRNRKSRRAGLEPDLVIINDALKPDLEITHEELEPGPFTKRIMTRTDDGAGELLTLECGHLLSRMVRTGEQLIPCAQCLMDWIDKQRADRAKAKGANAK
jgi:hypothetical protein